jgi:hypothetical protein
MDSSVGLVPTNALVVINNGPTPGLSVSRTKERVDESLEAISKPLFDPRKLLIPSGLRRVLKPALVTFRTLRP